MKIFFGSHTVFSDGGSSGLHVFEASITGGVLHASFARAAMHALSAPASTVVRPS
jgi:hypothetical protein